MKRYAINARDLLESRKQGRRPSTQVAVCLTGGSVQSPVVYVRPDMVLGSLDWQMLIDLHVCILADLSVPIDRVLQVCQDVARSKPRTLVLHFADKANEVHSVDIGEGTHRLEVIAMGGKPIPAEHSFCWLPVTETWTKLARKLKSVLANNKPKDLNP